MVLALSLLTASPQAVEKADPQLYCMAENIYHEARGETKLGQVAVANVVLNRVAHRNYPSTICGVTRQSLWVIRGGKKIRPQKYKCQFSWYCDGKSDYIKGNKSWRTAYKISVDAIYGTEEDPTLGSTHYHATYVNPYWVKEMTKQVKIGTHIFYRMTRDVNRQR